MSSSADGLCMCTGDIKCPHSINSKLPVIFDDIEKSIDTILSQFDRRAIKKFLKNDHVPEKGKLTKGLDDTYGQPLVNSEPIPTGPPHRDMKNDKSKGGLNNTSNYKGGSTNYNNNDKSHTMMSTVLGQSESKRQDKLITNGINNNNSNSGNNRPNTSAGLTSINNNNNNNHNNRPGTSGSMLQSTNEMSKTLKHTNSGPPSLFTSMNNSMSQSAPLLPKVITATNKPKSNQHERDLDNSFNSTGGAAPLQAREAWGIDDGNNMQLATITNPSDKLSRLPSAVSKSNAAFEASVFPSKGKPIRDEDVVDFNKVMMDTLGRQVATDDDEGDRVRDGPMTGDVMLKVGLMRMADIIAKKVLPWQAVCCPRAVETFRDIRLGMILQRHQQFMQRMSEQLEGKIVNFLLKKDEEIDVWVDREVTGWQGAVLEEDKNLALFISDDSTRISDRWQQQMRAKRNREMVDTNVEAKNERSLAKDQLIQVRRLVKTEYQHNIDVKALRTSIDSATQKITSNVTSSSRETVRKVEESHEWLLCIADNAITAAESEVMLKGAFADLDTERSRGLTALKSATDTYVDQQNTILDAVLTFSGKIHRYASDFLRREQLVARSFLIYMTGILSGEVRGHTSNSKKDGLQWEAKQTSDRAHKKEILLFSEFNKSVQNFDKLCNDLKERLKFQGENMKLKLQGVINGRDQDITKRKAVTHKKLAKHVNKMCQNRRLRLKLMKDQRKDEVEIENKCIIAISNLLVDLRNAVDSGWVRELLKERRMYEAAVGRMERLEKSAMIIWNKHSGQQLSVESKEDSEDWLISYRKDRGMVWLERMGEMERDFKKFRQIYGTSFINFVKSQRPVLRAFYVNSCLYDISHVVDKNIEDLLEFSEQLWQDTSNQMQVIRKKLVDYLDNETMKAKDSATKMRQQLLTEWQDNLYRLNVVINRRISSLKDMESDLEETIRLTIAQHEVEATVFEQTSCSRFEQFWIEWGNNFNQLKNEIEDNYDKYCVAAEQKKQKVAKLDSQKQRTLADKDREQIEVDAALDENNFDSSSKKSYKKVSDNEQVKLILDEVRTEHIREYGIKVSRGLESLRRDLGVGKKKLIPAYLALKVLFAAADLFWDRSRLSEKCVGRLTRLGSVIKFEGLQFGLPTHGRSLFCIGTGLHVISALSTRKGGLIDIEDIFKMLDKGIKRIFLSGLVLITLQFGGFGESFIKSECLWACSVCDIHPPSDLVHSCKDIFQQYEGLGLDPKLKKEFDANVTDNEILNFSQKNPFYSNSFLSGLPTSGFFSDDPIDLVNSILAIPVLLSSGGDNSKAAANNSKSFKGGSQPQEDTDDYLDITSTLGSRDASNLNFASKSELDSYAEAARRQEIRILADMTERADLTQLTAKMAANMARADISALSAILGRPDSTIEVTPHRFVQALALWRKTSYAIVQGVLDSPGIEYVKISDILTEHSAMRAGKRRSGYANIVCMSPFAAFSSTIDWMTSIRGVPISVLQSLSLLTKSGSVDPWLEDPKQTGRGVRFTDELKEFLQIIFTENKRQSPGLQIAIPANIREIVEKIDVSGSQQLPLELLRSYLSLESDSVSNSQATAAFWSICRCKVQEDSMAVSDEKEKLDASSSFISEDLTGDIIDDDDSGFRVAVSGKSALPQRKIVKTEFKGDPSDYMVRFSSDVQDFLNSMPSLDSNCVLGLLPLPLTPAAAHELVTDAVRLDVSARNPMPPTTAIWIGSRLNTIDDAVNTVSVPGVEPSPLGEAPRSFLGVGSSFLKHTESLAARRMQELRMCVELNYLAVYPTICDHRNNTPEEVDLYENHEARWKGLIDLRMTGVNKTMTSWRNITLNEWANSLYISRQDRFVGRVKIINECVNVYHKQYMHLRDSIIQGRGDLIKNFAILDGELLENWRREREYLTHNTSYLDRILRLSDGYINRCFQILRDVFVQFRRHCGTIKRRALSRVKKAHQKLQGEMDRSCQGLIVGYTGGFAQSYFDQLMQRGEVLRVSITDLHGVVIFDKEKFIFLKDELERELTCQVADKITMDRARTKSILDSLAEDTAQIQEQLATTRGMYANIQKDANARLVARIEKAVREARKLRAAAERQSELENLVLKEIKGLLDSARTSCKSIVRQITQESMRSLHSVIPLRAPHRAKMENKITQFVNGWKDIENVLGPLIGNFKLESTRMLNELRSKARNNIEVFRDFEVKKLNAEMVQQRALLMNAYRGHFRTYDLSETAIFYRYNVDIKETVTEIRQLWGPTPSSWIRNAMHDIDELHQQSIMVSSGEAGETLQAAITNKFEESDDTRLQRNEIADVSSYAVQQYREIAFALPNRFEKEKQDLVSDIVAMQMTNNNDMVRPQIIAVMDLIISGIEIESDFTKGYESLCQSTHYKSDEAIQTLEDFAVRYTSESVNVSIPCAAKLIFSRIDRRKEEVTALVEAANAHLVADHSRMDVLLVAAEKDIEEWANLTNELVDNAFNNADETYLTNIFPEGPASPRNDPLPDDEDRVARIKETIKNAQNASSEMYELIEQPEEEFVEDLRKKEKEAKKKKKIPKSMDNYEVITAKPGKPGEVQELQENWFQCLTEDGQTYYFNKVTSESLWELPESLKKPISDDMSLQGTPRDVLFDNAPTPKGSPRGIQLQYDFTNVKPAEMAMEELTDTAALIASFTVETAIEVTNVIRGSIRHVPKDFEDRSRQPSSPGFSIVDDSHSKYRDLSTIPRKVQDRFADDNYSFGEENITDLGSVDPINGAAYNKPYMPDGEERDRGLLLKGYGDDNLSATKSADEKELLDDGLGSIDDSQSAKLSQKALDEQEEKMRQIEVKFNEDRESRLMTQEEQLSKKLNEMMHAEKLEVFRTAVKVVVKKAIDVGLHQDDFDNLKEKTRNLRKLAIVEVLVDNKTSWEILQDMVYATLAGEEEARILAQTLKSEEGRERLRIIKEHEDDIEDLCNFFKDEAGLSKVISRKISIEAVVRNITTAKKMAKVWLRGGLDLRTLGLDEDDITEVESALQLILSKSNTTAQQYTMHNSMAQSANNFNSAPLAITNNFGSTKNDEMNQLVVLNNTNNSFANTATEVSLQQTQNQSFAASASSSSAYYQADATAASKSFKEPVKQLDPSSSFHLNASTINSAASEFKLMPVAEAHKNQSFNNTAQTQSSSSGGVVTGKSFRGGWVECVATEGHIYYYNTVTGESVWELPQGATSMPSSPDKKYGEQAPSQSYNSFYSSQHPQSNSAATTNANEFEQTPQYDEHGGYYDEHGGYYDAYGGYYDANGVYYPAPGAENDAEGGGALNTSIESQNNQSYSFDYDNNGKNPYHVSAGTLDDALGSIMSYDGPKGTIYLQRDLPIPTLPEVLSYSRDEGVNRQEALHKLQETWQADLAQAQGQINAYKSEYMKYKADQFEKASAVVDNRLLGFVNEIKYMQKSVKKDLGDITANERDLRSLFDNGKAKIENAGATGAGALKSASIEWAENLGAILEALEKLKINSNIKFDNAVKQIEKFGVDWQLISNELLQVGSLYDDQIAVALDQVIQHCQDVCKYFVFEETMKVENYKVKELVTVRSNFNHFLCSDDMDAQNTRQDVRQSRLTYVENRNAAKEILLSEYGTNDVALIESELDNMGYPPVDPKEIIRPEEEILMSFMLRQVEMEVSLLDDYVSVAEATGTIGHELLDHLSMFDSKEKKEVINEGSWFNKHREAITRHAQALEITLQKIRGKVDDGYRTLTAKIEALDYDVERAAEEALAS